MELDLFDFSLPKELIAQAPLQARDQARLLHLDPQGNLEDCFFSGNTAKPTLKSLLRPGDVIVLNNTKVIPAKICGYTHNSLGIKRSLSCNLIEQLSTQSKAQSEIWKVMIKGKIRIGDDITFSPNLMAKVIDKLDEFVVLEFIGDFQKSLEEIGEMPLPPYIKRDLQSAKDEPTNTLNKTNINSADKIAYQTVYAKEPGAVAAPTAGLHFTDKLLQEIQDMKVEIHYLTLHVGAGTFLPIRCNQIEKHKMHKEIFSIPLSTAKAVNKAKLEDRRVIAVGTTSLRALESACSLLSERCKENLSSSFPSINACHQQNTDIFIYPGYTFQIVDALITNFHLPKSTLFLLVSAFVGIERMQKAYQYAIQQRYRFYSYGDGSFLEKPCSN